MGVILNGILGGFSGKVGPVVGGKWKDVDYMRSYVVPANPNTTGQQTVRNKFSQLVATGRLLIASILQPFWDPFQASMSGFNAWISQNYALSDANGDIDETAIISKGTLYKQEIGNADYNDSTGVVTYSWNEVLVANQLTTDLAYAVVYDTVAKLFYFNVTGVQRNLETITVTIPSGLTPTNVIAFLFFSQGTGSELIVSDSDGVVCEAT